MTAVAMAGSPPRAGSQPLKGTWTLLRLALRRDRVLIPVWVLALGLSVSASSSSLKRLYDSATERAEFANSINANSSMRSLYGPAFSDSVGGLTTLRMLGFIAILGALMSLTLVVRHTREEEETGRQEMLSAAMVGRRAPLTAALLAAIIANVALGLVIGLGMAGVGEDVAGSFALGAAVAGVGVVFAGVAAITAQLTESARLARGLAGAMLGGAFVVRAAGDAVSDGGNSALTWMSPLGWAENVRAYADERWWVLGLFAVVAVATMVVAYALAGRRDVGMSFLAARPGPARAAARLGSPLGLAWRLQRGAFYGWLFAIAVSGLVFGAITKGAADLVDENASTREIFERMGGQQGLIDSFLASLVTMLGMVTAMFAVASVLRLSVEENSGRAEPILANAVSRIRFAGSHAVIAFVGSTVIMVLSGLALAVGYGVTIDDTFGQVERVVGASMVQVPAIWLLAGFAMFLYGMTPRLAAVAWGIVGAVVAVGWLGPALDLPQWVSDLSPFTHLPKLPGSVMEWGPVSWLVAAAAVFAVVGLARFRRRDIG